MLLQQKIEQVETREVKLPYHCKKIGLCSSYYYRVNKDESVLAISIIEDEYANMAVHGKPTGYLRELISEATPCEPIEVEQAKNKALEVMDTILQKAIA